MAWTISLTELASEQLSAFPTKHQRQIKDSIERMKPDPFQGDVEPLKGFEWQGRYRKRVGRYRLVFIPNRQTQTVIISQVLIRSEKTYRK